MHTAHQLDVSHFQIEVAHHPSSRNDVFPRWEAHDRLGVVVDRPLGAVGASLLIQLAITAYYDAREDRRGGPMYPEVYLFHLGKRHGNFAYYDVYPPRKEVVVSVEPAEILEAINDRAISRLAVVDGPVEPVIHHWKEPGSALERVVGAFAYHPSGRVEGADVEITAKSRRAEINTRIILGERRYINEFKARREASGAPSNEAGMRIPKSERVVSTDYLGDDVPSSVRNEIIEQRKSISTHGLWRESYRRIPVADALNMLGMRERSLPA